MKNNIYPIILAGGSGTRLWPLSRELRPKQLLNFLDNQSLIEISVNRCHSFSKNKPCIVTKKSLKDQLEMAVSDKDADYLIEPSPRGTAVAIFYAAIEIYKKDPESVMVVLTADHKVGGNFGEIIKKSVSVAEKTNSIILLGITPTKPETGYGYIKTGKKIENDCFLVEKFIEKPDKIKALEFLKNDKYLWNSGLFIAKTKTFIKEIKENMPALFPLLDLKEKEIADFYDSLEEVSIDYGVLEKTKNISVLKTDLDWSDLGSWEAIYEIMPKDQQGNYLAANCIVEKSKNSMFLTSPKRLMVGLGLENLIVVDTEDATLICNSENVDDIKKIVGKIKQSGGKEHIEHKTTFRPWGKYTILDEGNNFKVKFIHVNPGEVLSLQKHKKRSEHWVVVKGIAKVTVGDKETILKQNESTFVPTQTVHRLENIGETELTIVEVSSGTYFGEDDIIRYEDIYNRKTIKQ